MDRTRAKQTPARRQTFQETERVRVPALTKVSVFRTVWELVRANKALVMYVGFVQVLTNVTVVVHSNSHERGGNSAPGFGKAPFAYPVAV